MLKAFKYRIYPTKKQTRAMDKTLGICQELYNCALLERRDDYKVASISITYQSQQNQLPEIKQSHPDQKEVHSLVLQDVLRRLDRAMQAFFRRVAKSEKVCLFLLLVETNPLPIDLARLGSNHFRIK
jgi:putative transposase